MPPTCHTVMTELHTLPTFHSLVRMTNISQIITCYKGLSVIRILDPTEGPKTKQRYEGWLEVSLVKREWKNISGRKKNRSKRPYGRKGRIHWRIQNRARRIGEQKECGEWCCLSHSCGCVKTMILQKLGTFSTQTKMCKCFLELYSTQHTQPHLAAQACMTQEDAKKKKKRVRDVAGS